jgi:hypothetical protein
MVPAMTLRGGLLTLALASSLLSSCAGQTAAPASTSGSLTKGHHDGGPLIAQQVDRVHRDRQQGVPDHRAPDLDRPGGVHVTERHVGCYLDPSAARCDISERDWSPPPRPADCEFDYGEGINLSAGEAPTR